VRLLIDGIRKEELSRFIKTLNWPQFRSRQIYQWVFSKCVTNISEMTNLSKEMQKKLQESCGFSALDVIKVQVSKEENTKKWLCEFSDGARVEMVLMRHSFGNSLCISTQAGCAMGCLFCASTLNGLERNLTAGELFAQVRLAQKELFSQGEKLNNLILMGTGEPLHNLKEVLVFLENIHDPEGMNFSYRRVTLSTCGIIPGITELIEVKLPINLAISLHASNDGVRSELMPINRTYPMSELIEIAQKYAESSGRRITYEYLLIENLNDQKRHAEELIALLKGKLASVNLIPYNPVQEKSFKRSKDKDIQQFYKLIEKSGIPVSIRREMGKDIDAACGQLRFNSKKGE